MSPLEMIAAFCGVVVISVVELKVSILPCVSILDWESFSFVRYSRLNC